MHRRRPILSIAVALCSALSVISVVEVAQGQEAVRQGAGIKVGNLELHPGVAMRGGYDTNVFRGDGDVDKGGQEIVGAGIFRVTPELYLSTITAKRAEQGESRGEISGPIRFRLGASGGFVHYASSDAEKYAMPQLPDAWEFGGNAQLNVLPDRPVGFDVGVAGQRNVVPFTASTGNANSSRVHLFKPSFRLNLGSASKVFTSFVGYAPGLTDYTTTFSYLSNWQHEFMGGAAWAFLPSTALLYEVNVGLQNYIQDRPSACDTAVGPSCPAVRTADNTKLKSRLGLNGALTNDTSLRALVGYVSLFVNDSVLSEKDGVVGDLTFIQRVASRHRLEAGYVHDVLPSPAGSWVISDRVGAKAVLNVSALILSVEAAYSHLRYGPILLANGDPAGFGGETKRSDNKFDAILHAEYGLLEWLSLLGDVTASVVMTEFDYANTLRNAPDPGGFTQLGFFGGLRAHY